MGTSLSRPLRLSAGTKTAKALSALGVETVGDLLRHYPRRYAERGQLTDLSRLVVGEQVTVEARVRTSNVHNNRLKVVVTDDKGATLSLTFFGHIGFHKKRMWPGREGFFEGKVRVWEYNSKRGRVRELQLTHPTVKFFDEISEEEKDDFAGKLIPVYPANKDIDIWRIGKAVAAELDVLDLADPVPERVLAARGLIGLERAFEQVHRPKTRAEVGQAVKRLKWDEAFLVQTVMAQRRLAADGLPAVPRPPSAGALLEDLDGRLPFELTAGQRAVGAEIAEELALEHPMHRLLQGEVGSGKTIVALRAMLQVVDAGGQAALLAPTEVLAQQHHRSITAMLGELGHGGLFGGTAVALLTGSANAASRRAALLQAASGEAGIVIGTHALLEEHVQFADLGLVVVDEQHRFGVEQRDALREKANGVRPHVLVMTATPIPRTIAMTVYGDLETSTLTELPAGRSPISTHVVASSDKPHFLERAWERIREEVGRGRQAYIVCPRIGGDETDDEENPDGEERRPPLAVMDVAPMLSEGPLAGLRVGVLHGRLHPDEKDAVMRSFAAGELDVLVATTVIEVGVDVPNATVMVIMDADRFGVSQLHQLRGRVGRGSHPGLCLLVTDMPEETPARERLDAVARTLDGFELSRVDLEQRREGDVLGASQHGRSKTLHYLSLIRDEDLIEDARREATAIVAEDPDLAGHPALRDAVEAIINEERAAFLEKT